MKEENCIYINEDCYDNIKPYLKKKDGYRHVVILQSYTNLTTGFFECEKMCTLQTDDFLVHMQKDGYEVIDVKISPIGNPSIIGAVSGYSIVIGYK